MIPNVPINNAPTEAAAPTVTYYARSWLTSRTLWFNALNFLVAVLSMTEVVTLIPPKWLPMQAAVVAVINMFLRTITVRPVAFIAPSDTKAVQVEKIAPSLTAAMKD